MRRLMASAINNNLFTREVVGQFVLLRLMASAINNLPVNARLYAGGTRQDVLRGLMASAIKFNNLLLPYKIELTGAIVRH